MSMTTMRDCPDAEVRDLLPDFVHGTLDERARAAVEAHVARCAACQAELRLLRAAHSALSRGPAVDVGAIGRAVAKSARPTRVPRAPRRGWGWQRAAAAAAIVVGGAGAVLATRGRSGDAPLPRLAAEQSAESAGGPAGGPTAAPTPAGASLQSGAAGAGEGLVLVAGTQELDDAELESLLGELETFEATPSVEPASVLPALLIDGGV
jgi:anti-sigma factor RsiW